MERQFYIYILTNSGKTTLYIGVTNDLARRIYEHREKILPGFTSRYNLNILVYYETFPTIGDAILREKQLKGGSRRKKIELINKFNPEWVDLYNDII